MTDNKLNIYQKIIEIRKGIESFVKDTTGFQYRYVSGTQVLSKIKKSMDELGVLLQPEITKTNPATKHEFQNYKGEKKIEFIKEGDMTYTWINAEQPEDRYQVRWEFSGMQDDPSKALGSGLTYSERYFLLKSFGVPTDDADPDSRQEKSSEPAREEVYDKCQVCGKSKTADQYQNCYTCNQAKKYGIKRDTANTPAPPQTPPKTDKDMDIERIHNMSRDELLYEVKTYRESVVPEMKSKFRYEWPKTVRYNEEKLNQKVEIPEHLNDDQLINLVLRLYGHL